MTGLLELCIQFSLMHGKPHKINIKIIREDNKCDIDVVSVLLVLAENASIAWQYSFT